MEDIYYDFSKSDDITDDKFYSYFEQIRMFSKIKPYFYPIMIKDIDLKRENN
jgi:hypothetical protein